jgi:hypothetical protein
MGWVPATLFFISLIIIGQYILFQLFLTILLAEFDKSSLKEEAKDKEQTRNNKKMTPLKRMKDLLSKLNQCLTKKCRRKAPKNLPS